MLNRETYTSRAGRNSVDPAFRAKMTNWDRNLVEGPLADMDVADGGWIVLIDRQTDDAPPLPKSFVSLKPIGLDGTFVERGAAVGGSGETPPAPARHAGWVVRRFHPVHPPRYPGA